MITTFIILWGTLSYIPGYFLLRKMHAESHKNDLPGDELPATAAMLLWALSPVVLIVLGIVYGWFWVANTMFPEDKNDSRSN